MNDINKLFKDLENLDLPKDVSAYEKIKCSLLQGKRIYWYFEEDRKFFEDEGENIKDFLNDIYSGVCITKPGVYNSGGEIEADDVVVVVDSYPIEKDYPDVYWVALKRLLDLSDLVEIIEK